ncbi:uncharacterized protein LOC135177764 [Pogoniulus pusillus]|uniref:uncharacterized protein LOC135177764 n=1 Tax=Pogoniulus pusillus TaxID=488313 RepID=UPI0030B924B0
MTWLSLVLSLTVALCLLCLVPHGPTLGISSWLLESRTQELPGEPKTQPGDAESMASRCQRGYGFCKPHRCWRGVLPEKAKQPDASPRSTSSEWPGCYNLRQLQQWGRVWMSSLLEDENRADKDPKNTFSDWPGSFALCRLQKWVCFRAGVLPESEKQPSADAESPFSEWPGSFGFQRPENWVRFRTTGVCPESQKNPDAGQESVFSKWPGSSGLRRLQLWASDLPFLLGQLWEHSAQADVTCPLYWACQTSWLLCMVWIALGLWTNAERPCTPGSSATESSAVRAECRKKDSQSRYEQLRRVEHRMAAWDSLVRRLCLRELRHRHYGKAAQEPGSQPAAE